MDNGPASNSSLDGALDNTKGALKDASRKAEAASDHPWFRKAARLGHIANGVLHFVIGVIALNLAFGSAPEDADQSGAIALLASNPLGMALVWICAAGCALLGLWHLSEAIWDRESVTDALKNVAKTVTYFAIGVSFTVAALGGNQDSGESTSSLSATLMSNPVGAVALIVLGAAIIIVGGYHVYVGITRKFEETLRTSKERKISQGIRVVGTIGYIAKGVVLALIGLLFVMATINQDPEDATGMDGALRALLDQPFGNWILGAIGIGLMMFGVYCFMRSRFEVEK
ncbi:MAG: DUF1206 domain-containing protein [Gulosibacter sp.]|uniref:DUF1206 domain-containing protein n=1 Tax=Gulosibacter sp. TaxID=2817531 RepID=UPI003F92AE72